MKRTAPKHPKMYALAAALKVQRPYAVGMMEMLWQFTAFNRPQGDIGSVPDKEIAEACGWEKKPSALIDALCASNVRFLNRHPEYRLYVHDWPEHAEYEVCRRLLQLKKDFLPVYGVSVTERAPNARTERARSAPNARIPRVGSAPSQKALATGKGLDSSEIWNAEEFHAEFAAIWEGFSGIDAGADSAVIACVESPEPGHMATLLLKRAREWSDNFRGRNISRNVNGWMIDREFMHSAPTVGVIKIADWRNPETPRLKSSAEYVPMTQEDIDAWEAEHK